MHPDMNWFGVLEHHARRTPDKPVAVFGDDVVTYQEMTEWAAALAAGLHARGVGAGDVVGLLSYNNIEFLATIFAANFVGAIAMPINWRLAAPELRFILEHSEARALVCDDGLHRARERSDEAARTATSSASASQPRRSRGGSAFADLAPSPHTGRVRTRRGRRHPPADVHVGHDRAPEGCDDHPRQPRVEELRAHHRVRLHRGRHRPGLRPAVSRRRARPRHHDDDRGGCDDDHPSASFDAAHVVDEIERSRVTTVWTAPAMVRAILDVPEVEARDLSSVRVLIAGGEKMPIPFIERLRRVFPSAWFADAYGLTETVSGDTFLDRESTLSKLGSVGRPCQYLELDIWDEHGASVPAGERGEVVLRGPKVFKGYWRDPGRDERGLRGRLVPHGRHRREGRRRLRLHRRPTQGHDRVGR